MDTQVEVEIKISKGATIKVVGHRGLGEKAPKGTLGTVFWMGENSFTHYGRTTVTTRVGFKTPEGKTFFTAASNLVRA